MLKTNKLIANYWAKRMLYLGFYVSQRKKTSNTGNGPTLTLFTHLYTLTHIHQMWLPLLLHWNEINILACGCGCISL